MSIAKLSKIIICPMIPEDIEELRKAEKAGLLAEYKTDNYIYLLNKDGTPGVFKGLMQNTLKEVNKDVNAPYLVCPVHTQQAWEEYVAAKAPATTDPVPTDPVQTDSLDPIENTPE